MVPGEAGLGSRGGKILNAQEYASSTDAGRLIKCLDRWSTLRRDDFNRKARLAATACCRRVWHLLDQRCNRALEAIEGMADDANLLLRDAYLAGVPSTEFSQKHAKDWAPTHYERAVWNACDAVSTLADDVNQGWPQHADLIAECVERALYFERDEEIFPRPSYSDLNNNVWVCGLIRDAFGNPFNPVTLPKTHRKSCDAIPGAAEHAYSHCGCPCPWLTRDVVAVANNAYHGFAHYACIDRSSLLVLADALEEAGCDNAVILGELRKDVPRYKGFWLTDLILRG